jgi:hypothetical protein
MWCEPTGLENDEREKLCAYRRNHIMTALGKHFMHMNKIIMRICMILFFMICDAFSPNLLAARNAKIPAPNLKVSNETASPTKIWRME